jgi:hypothetical protein
MFQYNIYAYVGREGGNPKNVLIINGWSLCKVLKMIFSEIQYTYYRPLRLPRPQKLRRPPRPQLKRKQLQRHPMAKLRILPKQPPRPPKWPSLRPQQPLPRKPKKRNLEFLKRKKRKWPRNKKRKLKNVKRI